MPFHTMGRPGVLPLMGTDHNSALIPAQPRGEAYNIHLTALDPQTTKSDRVGPPKNRVRLGLRISQGVWSIPSPNISETWLYASSIINAIANYF